MRKLESEHEHSSLLQFSDCFRDKQPLVLEKERNMQSEHIYGQRRIFFHVFHKKEHRKCQKICYCTILVKDRQFAYEATNFRIQKIKQKCENQISCYHHLTFFLIRMQWFLPTVNYL